MSETIFSAEDSRNSADECNHIEDVERIDVIMRCIKNTAAKGKYDIFLDDWMFCSKWDENVEKEIRQKLNDLGYMLRSDTMWNMPGYRISWEKK
jgi:hypothetical protein